MCGIGSGDWGSGSRTQLPPGSPCSWRFGRVLLGLLTPDSALVEGDNEPYAVSDETDYGIVEYGERRGYPHVELEIRQDLIADEAGQAEWAERLARLLRDASATLADRR